MALSGNNTLNQNGKLLYEPNIPFVSQIMFRQIFAHFFLLVGSHCLIDLHQVYIINSLL